MMSGNLENPMRRLVTLAIALLLSATMAISAKAGTFTDDQKMEMEDIIHSYLLAHPWITEKTGAEVDMKVG